MSTYTGSLVGKLFLWIPVFVLCLTSPVFAQVVPYPQLPGRALSSTYTVTVNGTSVPVQQYNGNSFAWFAFSGSADVKVNVNQTVSTYRLSPMRNQVPSTASGNVISFALTQPKKLVLNKVNGLTERLFILADPLEQNPPVLGAAGVFNVKNYGADGSGGGNSTSAIQQAIDAATAYPGGGVAFVPAGTYNITGMISLKSNVNLYLAPGAMIRPQAGSFSYSLMFGVSNAVNAKISGRGVIHGRGSEGSFGYLNVLDTNLANNMRLQDVMFLDGYSTAIRVVASSNSTLDNLKILSNSPNASDGVDWEANTNMVISNCFISSSDDNIAVGSGTNVFNYGVPGNTDGLKIIGNVFIGTTGGKVVSIVPWRGTPYIRNITFDNNDVIAAGPVFTIYPFGGTNVSAVTYSNSSVEQTDGKLIEFLGVDCTSWGSMNCGAPMGVLGYIKNIRIDNLTVGNFASQFSLLQGFNSTADVDGVVFNNLRIAGYLVNSASAGNITIGPYVYNVVYSATAADTLPPVAPVGLRVF
jgi:polygalacturonase